jgi:hypothetical protein
MEFSSESLQIVPGIYFVALLFAAAVSSLPIPSPHLHSLPLLPASPCSFPFLSLTLPSLPLLFLGIEGEKNFKIKNFLLYT